MPVGGAWRPRPLQSPLEYPMEEGGEREGENERDSRYTHTHQPHKRRTNSPAAATAL